MEVRKRTTLNEIYQAIKTRKVQNSISVKDLTTELSQTIRNFSKFQSSKYKNALAILSNYLSKYETLKITEDFLYEFSSFVKDTAPKGNEGKSAAPNIRHVINKAGENSAWLPCPLINGISYTKYSKFTSFEENTQKALIQYESEAKQIKTNRLPYKNKNGTVSIYKEFYLLKKPLSLSARYNRLDLSIQLLSKTGKKDLNKIVVEDLDAISKRSQKELCPFFANIHQWGFLEKNIFCEVDLDFIPPSKEVEFLTKESIDRLFEAARQIKKFNYVDARTITICLLAYDSCLRVGEFTSLKLSDISKEDDITILKIRSEIQKGQDKIEKYMLFSFDLTVKILSYFIKNIRPFSNNSNSPFLFPGSKNERISDQVVRHTIKKIQKPLSLELYHDKNRRITPHHFRRTFGTLNAPGVGLNLSLDELAARMRHDNPDTTREHYISKNVYLEKMKLKHN